MRFALIDRIIDRSADRLVAVKCVSSAEEYLADHFPGFAVLPGVMMLEAMVQAGRALVDRPADAAPLVLSQVRTARYGNMVKPGQSLQVEVRLLKQLDGEWELDGVGTVDGDVAVQCRFRLAPLPTSAPRRSGL